MADFKVCQKCGKNLPTSEFSQNVRNNDQRHSYCKRCASKIVKEKKAEMRKMMGDKPWYLR